MAKVTWKLEGIRGLEAAIDRIGPGLTARVAALNRDTAFSIRAVAQQHAPVDRGDLRNAISAQGTGPNWRVGILDTSLPSRGGRNTAHWNPWVYGVWYEYGFRSRNIQKHPFMRPALDTARPRYEQGIAGLARAAERDWSTGT